MVHFLTILIKIKIMQKYIYLFLFVFSLLSSVGVSAQATKISFEVAGKCDMCKDRIESALDIKGVRMAYWSVDTKICKVTYNPSKITEKQIYKTLAEAGHDTQACKAPDKAYNGLHHCCRYERPDYSK